MPTHSQRPSIDIEELSLSNCTQNNIFYFLTLTYVNIQAGQTTRISPRYRGLVYGKSQKEGQGNITMLR
ncbi:hypothetical protein M8J77_011419 [Diaphorina citri]|nr:hypothetical protein M8J77_011419 [Diaphorina citri]